MSGALDNRPWGVGHAAVALLAGLIAAVVAGLAVGPELSDAETFRVLIPAQTLTQVGLVALWASQSARRRLALGLRMESGDLMGIPLGLAFQVAASIALLPIIVWVLDGEPPTQEVVESAAALSGIDVLFVVVGAGLLAPLAEELVFRGVLLRALLVHRGVGFATYVSAAGFAAIHLLDPNAWLVVPILFVLGVILARQTITTGRLAKAFFTHTAFNLVAVGALFLGG